MRVLFVVSSNPLSKDYTTIFNLVKELVKKGEVVIFFTGNGAYYTIRPETEGLKKLGARLLYCAHSAHQRGIKETLSFFESSSTYNLSRIMPECQRVLSFN